VQDIVTIYDIAAAAHVSPSTVSKALNGRNDVSIKTRKHVIKVASKMGYHPNAQARSLKLKKSYLIGVVFEDEQQSVSLDHPLFLPLMVTFKSLMEKHGYELIFLSHGSLYEGENLVAHAFSRQVDALFLLSFYPRDISSCIALSRGLPMVCCDSIIPGIPSVITDNIGASEKAVAYLNSLGHTKIAHIAGPTSNGLSIAGDERLEGYLHGLEACGLPYDDTLIARAANWSADAGKVAFKTIFERTRGDFTAVYAAADFYVMGLRQYCIENNMVIPRDLSVVGFDDAPWAQYVEPGFTTFKQDEKVLGETAANILLGLIDGGSQDGVIRIPAIMRTRGSCQKKLFTRS
jgi:DNA-binding LacI/PurR family transcriptional regulator